MKRWDLAVRKRKWNMTGLSWDHNDNSLSPIFPPKQTRNHNPTARNLSTLNTFSPTIHIALLRERRPSQDCLTVRQGFYKQFSLGRVICNNFI